MKNIDEIVELFGGPRPMARAMDIPPSTVSSWQTRKSIPDWWHERIVEAATKLGLVLSLADVFQASCNNNTAPRKAS